MQLMLHLMVHLKENFKNPQLDNNLQPKNLLQLLFYHSQTWAVDPEQEYFADGITEDIITNLSLWRTFPVISRNSSYTFRGQSHNLKQVASELGARYIVEGSVLKGGNRVRITAQLIDAEEDHHLWSEKLDRTLEDIFDVQDEVSETIARRTAPSVRGHEQNRLTRKRPENLSALEEHLQGLQCYHERQRKDYEDLGLAQARQHFE